MHAAEAILGEWQARFEDRPRPRAGKAYFAHELVFAAPVTASRLDELEHALAMPLPREYRDFMTAFGPLSIRTTRHVDGRTYSEEWTVGRMLLPDEIICKATDFRTWVERDGFGVDETSRAAADRENRIRSRMIPFQYVPPYESDLFCFYSDASTKHGTPILVIHHDDFELAAWLGSPLPALDDVPFDLATHLDRMIADAVR
jgi:hypothetical protein